MKEETIPPQMDNSHKNTTKNVLLVALSRGYGGADVRVYDLACAFHGRFPYAVAVLHNSPLHRKLEKAGLHTRPLPYRRRDPRLLFQLRRLIREEQFDVVDAHNPQSQFWGLWAARWEKTAVLISTVHHAYGDVKHLRLIDRLYEYTLHLNMRWGATFITVSRSIYDYLLRIGVPPPDLALIPNAIDMDRASAALLDDGWRQQLGWGADKVIIIVVGRLEAVKGHTYLLAAMKTAVSQHPHLRCLLVGDGRLRPEIEQQIEALQLEQYVHLAGFREDVPALLHSSDIFCLSSLSEGLPYALLEAAVYRLPFVVTAVDGMAELLTNEQNALLVPAADPDALAQAFGRLADDKQKRKALGNAAHDLIQQKFSPAIMLTETMHRYQMEDNA